MALRFGKGDEDEMKIMRTAGPLGRSFGFLMEIGRFAFGLNAGWYVVSLRCRGVGYVQLATKPMQLDWYIDGGPDGSL